MNGFHFKIYFICTLFSAALMALFVFINLPYYKSCYGGKTTPIVLRTLLLNTAAICIGWAPVVYLWPSFSLKFLLPFACILGALGCVGSRFIYNEILPEELARRLIELIEQKTNGTEKKDT
jgi:hypothetical protein